MLIYQQKQFMCEKEAVGYLLSIILQDLKQWGVRNKKHRHFFITGKELIETESAAPSKDDSADMFLSSSQTFSSSQSSQISSGVKRTQSFEVVEITMKKSISSSSDSS